MSDEQWRQRVQVWCEDRSWVRYRDSAPPDKDDCMVLAAILAEFGIAAPGRARVGD